MRTALLRLFRQSPFEGLLRHADYIRQAGPIFRLALIAYLDENPEEFEKHHNQVTILENQGDHVKRNIRGHLPRGILMPMDKFQLIWYLREQDKILDSVQDALHWLSYRKTDIPDEMVDDLLLLVEKVNEVLKAVYPLVSSAESYFSNFSEQQREKVKKEIRLIREYEFESDQVERELLSNILAYPFENPTSAFHLARLVEYMGNVANHAENAGDMMRAMIAR
ncbi:MAG: TIGR00153 family protein [Desulforhabdus sp.]|jgi:predicted phosphate transport protein (TIGR00153 family)|nr:TIGR00153 family protein [Desulforhabdus sp.]